MMELVKRGQIKPIEPMTVFSFEDIQGAFRYMRGGAHSGKIIISNGTKEDFEVPVSLPPGDWITPCLLIPLLY